jgi:hypothetical protein
MLWNAKTLRLIQVCVCVRAPSRILGLGASASPVEETKIKQTRFSFCTLLPFALSCTWTLCVATACPSATDTEGEQPCEERGPYRDRQKQKRTRLAHMHERGVKDCATAVPGAFAFVVRECLCASLPPHEEHEARIIPLLPEKPAERVRCSSMQMSALHISSSPSLPIATHQRAW